MQDFGKSLMVIDGRTWHTPATDYPIKKVGSARLVRAPYQEGCYRMEGVDGAVYYEVREKAIPVTELRIDGSVWMVDDPLHWIGMKRLAQHSGPRVLTSGLGLGLYVQALQERIETNHITVVERNEDVIALIKPLLKWPDDTRLETVNDDLWRYLRNTEQKFDTVMLDLWVTNEDMTYAERRRQGADMIGSLYNARHYQSDADVFIWGYRDIEVNPALTEEGLQLAKDAESYYSAQLKEEARQQR